MSHTMDNRSNALVNRLRTGLQWLFAFSLASVIGLTIALIAFGWYREIRALDELRARLWLTAVCLLIGAWHGLYQLRSDRAFPRSTRAGMAAILISQICFLLLVWTNWKAVTLLWRLWWIGLVGTVTATHVIVLRGAALAQRSRLITATIVCALLSGLWFLGLALRADLLATPPPWYLWLGVLPALGAVLGSVVVWYRTRPEVPAEPRSRWWRLSWVAASQVALLLVGFYLGRITAPAPSPFDLSPSPLATLPPEKLDALVRADLAALKTVTAGVDDLGRKMTDLQATLRARLAAENRTHYRPDEEDQLRAQFLTYLTYRTACLRMVATYGGFAAVRDPAARDRCFLVGFGAGTTVFQASLRLVQLFRDDALARPKLNEPDASCGLPAGMFDRIFENATQEQNLEMCAEMAAYFQQRRDRWRAAVLFPVPDFDWLAGQIEQALSGVKALAIDRYEALWERMLLRVKQDAYSPVYTVQSMVSTWIGDTRVMQRPPFIDHHRIAELKASLEPGDILLERRNWFLSNAFLPGFWPHAALYVGEVEDLERLGLVRRDNGQWTSDHPAIRDRLPDYLHRAADGEAHTVIESISNGVVFNSLAESMHADYVAVLRPRLMPAEKATAIVRAFSHQGKPYDFEFDFATADKLVCTELVYRSYEGLLRFELVRIMGRSTLPAVEIGNKYARERGSGQQQLDFVLFLDGLPAECSCRRGTEKDFCDSCSRPRAFNE
jgi:hypothetical protein